MSMRSARKAAGVAGSGDRIGRRSLVRLAVRSAKRSASVARSGQCGFFIQPRVELGQLVIPTIDEAGSLFENRRVDASAEVVSETPTGLRHDEQRGLGEQRDEIVDRFRPPSVRISPQPIGEIAESGPSSVACRAASTSRSRRPFRRARIRGVCCRRTAGYPARLVASPVSARSVDFSGTRSCREPPQTSHQRHHFEYGKASAIFFSSTR